MVRPLLSAVPSRDAWNDEATRMTLPTEPIGSIPRPPALQAGMAAAANSAISAADLETLYDDAVRDTIRRFEGTGSPVITDGEQTKPSFAAYPLVGSRRPPAARRTRPCNADQEGGREPRSLR